PMPAARLAAPKSCLRLPVYFIFTIFFCPSFAGYRWGESLKLTPPCSFFTAPSFHGAFFLHWLCTHASPEPTKYVWKSSTSRLKTVIGVCSQVEPETRIQPPGALGI